MNQDGAARRPRDLNHRRFVAPLIAMALVSGCATPKLQTVSPGENAIVLGPSVRDNRTPMEAVFACFSDHIAAVQKRPIIIGVGDIKDYTGKYSINEGNAITQGGALMVYSALGKLGGMVGIAERFDPTVAERELGYIDRRQLGDGDVHEIPGPQGNQEVPWVPYFGGTIIKSDYYIVGGITELNYDISSGGAEVGVNQIGGKARVYNESIAVDLRIVDTKTLMVVRTVSLTKQLTGYEVGFNIFRFFDSDLFDINLGAKGQEPLQLGVRTALEEAVVRLVGAVTRVDPNPCMTMQRGSRIPAQTADELRQVKTPPAIPAAAVPAPAAPARAAPAPAAAVQPSDGAINSSPSVGDRPLVETVPISFEFGAGNIGGAALAGLDRAAAMSKVGPVEILVLAQDTENWDPAKRDALINQRIVAITAALAQRGVSPASVRTVWRPSSSDTSIHLDGPGRQQIAKLRIGA
jgi:curli biogenesis system outer membrane secretion channel CsgG